MRWRSVGPSRCCLAPGSRAVRSRRRQRVGRPGCYPGRRQREPGGAIPMTIGSVARWVVGGGRGMRSMFGFASRMTRAVLLYIVALLIAFAFPGVVSRVKAYLVDRPGLSALGGLAIVLGF